MKKTYFAPVAKTIDLATESPLLADSKVGLEDGAGLGNGFNSEDVSYSNKRRIIWDDEF